MASVDTKIDSNDRAPKAHLAYNIYRKMLSGYNNQANDYIDSLPKNMVEDGEIYKHIENLM